MVKTADDGLVLWEAQERQAALISCPVHDVFFGGARGGGKTDATLGDWIEHQDTHGKHAKGIFFRRTNDELEEAQARARELFTPLGAVYKESKRIWMFPNGATLKMRFLFKDADIGKYQGHSYTWICFEELTNWPDLSVLDKMRACLRSRAGVPCYFRATGNPGGVGHNQVKARYIDPAPPFTPFYDKEGKTWRCFIPSRLEDNPALALNDPDYWTRVEASASGNTALLKAWKDGDWDIVAGGMFDDLWKREHHVIEPFRIPSSWRIDRTFDWGSSKPFSVGWWAESDGTLAPNGRYYPRGTLFRIAEWYGWNGKPNQGTKMLATEVARGIIEREMAMGYRVLPGPADSQIYTSENGASIADDMAALGVHWVPADKAPGSRKNGWERFRKVLKASLENSREDAGLYVFSTCTDGFIRTVPVLPRDPRKPDDVDTAAEDHAGDESRYKVLQHSGQGTVSDEALAALSGWD